MTPELLSLIMDFAVLVALAGTIYYAMRLTRALNNFKAQREDMKRVILDLSTHIDKAQTAIAGLKQASDTAANDLDDVLHDSRRMAEELKIINETGNALAGRLERLASQGRKASRADEADIYEEPSAPASFDKPSFKPKAKTETAESPAFFIKDADFDDRSEGDFDDEMADAGAGEFASRAERELYEALQKNRQGGGGRK